MVVVWLFELLTFAGALLVALVSVWVLGGGMSRRAPVPTAACPQCTRARGILDERYVRGEFSTAEHRERLQALQER